jgi:hypothetical protein
VRPAPAFCYNNDETATADQLINNLIDNAIK